MSSVCRELMNLVLSHFSAPKKFDKMPKLDKLTGDNAPELSEELIVTFSEEGISNKVDSVA